MYPREILSRVLSEHAGNNLYLGGGRNWKTRYHNKNGGCIMQVIDNTQSTTLDNTSNPFLGRMFDSLYKKNWTPAELLIFIEKYS